MGNWQNVTLADIAKGFARYRPFIAVLAGVILVAAFMPGQSRGPSDVTASELDAALGTTQTTVAGDAADAGGDIASTDGTTVDGATTAGVTGGGGTVGTGGPARSASTGGSTAGATSGGGATSTGAQPVPAGTGADCDPATGRIRIPTKFAAPCKPIVAKAQNGGATSFGVTADEITIVWYRGVADPAVTAALTAAGAADQREDVDHTVQQYADILTHHFNLYGRKIKFHIHNGDAKAEDDAQGRADAKAVVDKYKPFAVINSVNNAFVDQLVASKVICICTTSQPQEFYEQRFPYAGWTTLMSSSQGYIHRAEYVGKRLAGQKARWAGTRDVTQQMNQEERVFGLLYYETPDNAYRGGVEFFKKELARYGVQLKEVLAYPSNLAQAQEQTRSLISKLKASGVNSVIFSGDPITPATFTTEAQNQRWQPEWIITGSALVDTTLFARTYNQDQWSRAFGISYLSLRFPEEQTTSFNIHRWHTGQPPRAGNTHGVLWAPFFILGTGMHMAGPQLTPQTFAKGLFEYPPTGGFVTAPHTSYGRHGIWDRDPWKLVDLTQYDDVTEIWWDRTATGPDEVGNNGVGMYRYVDGGKRYLPGQHPQTPPKAFDPNGAPTILDRAPENERAPEYEHKHHYHG